jgi:hypothetical protein
MMRDGTDYTESDDRIQEVYAAVRDGIAADQTVTWEHICGEEFFNLEIPEYGTDHWTAHVQRRCQMKSAVNKRAGRMGQDWRLYTMESGVSLTKRHKTKMVKGEIVHKMKRVAGALAVMAKASQEMQNATGLTARDKARLEQTRYSAEGARLNYVGMIQSMDSLDKGTKTLLLSMFDVDVDNGDDEE